MERTNKTAKDMWIPPNVTVTEDDNKFSNCSQDGCSSSSAFSQYNRTTLIIGFETCATHTTMASVSEKVQNTTMNENPVFIFYDVEIISTREIEQLSAFTTTGAHFDSVIRTTTRSSTNPMLSKLSAMAYNIAAIEPRTTMEHFILWVDRMMREQSNRTATHSDVVLVAHNGMCHQHILLIKTMMTLGIVPPAWRFSNSLPIFKIVIRPNDTSCLNDLVFTYVSWFFHTQHDALSNATGLEHMLIAAVPDWQIACYVFSCSCESFIRSVGLSSSRVRNSLPFSSIDT